MKSRADRIKELIEESEKSYQELEKITGIKKSSLQRYASGATTKIPLDAIEKLSAAFNVSQEYLMGWEDEKENKKNSTDKMVLTDGEKKILELFRRIPEDKQDMAIEMIRAALNSQK